MNKVHFIIVLLILCFPLTGRAQNTWANSEILPYDTVVTVTDYSRPVAVKDTLNEEELFDLLNEVQENSKQFKTCDEWFEYMEDYSKQLKEQA